METRQHRHTRLDTILASGDKKAFEEFNAEFEAFDSEQRAREQAEHIGPHLTDRKATDTA